MAGNPAWCKSAGQWRKQVAHWLSRAEPQDILNADIFFDALPVHGDHGLVDDLRRDAISAASRTMVFLQLMDMSAAKARPPVNWLGRFSLEEDGRMDLKMHGIMPIFSAARVLALRHALAEHSTAARLNALRGKPGVLEERIDGLLEAHQIILRRLPDG